MPDCLKRLLPLTLLVSGLSLSGVACSPGGTSSVSTAPDLTYAMERNATGLMTNALLLNFPEGTGYQFKVTGDNLTSDTPFDVFLPMLPRVEFSYTKEGSFTIELEITQANGTPYIADTLTWSYSTLTPLPPVVSFSELATSDASVSMLIGASRLPIDNEIWVEGDLSGDHADGGFWAPLADSGIYVVSVSEGDGLKTMKVKLRNIYGNESAAVDASIVRKSTFPTNCAAEFEGPGSSSRNISLKLSATNDGPLYYNVYGDIDTPTDFREFTSGDSVTVRMSSGEGQKEVTIRIQDAAGNACEDIKQTLNLSGGYVTHQLEIEGNPLWSDEDDHNLLLRYDHFASQEPIEMKITGDITGTGVGAWIPFQATFPITLMPVSGEKKVYVQFRDNTLTPSFLVLVRVYYHPTITITNAGNPLVGVVLSKVRGTNSITITGCTEAYNEVDWASSFACHPNAATIHATYNLSDDTTLVLSAVP